MDVLEGFLEPLGIGRSIPSSREVAPEVPNSNFLAEAKDDLPMQVAGFFSFFQLSRTEGQVGRQPRRPGVVGQGAEPVDVLFFSRHWQAAKGQSQSMIDLTVFSSQDIEKIRAYTCRLPPGSLQPIIYRRRYPPLYR